MKVFLCFPEKEKALEHSLEALQRCWYHLINTVLDICNHNINLSLSIESLYISNYIYVAQKKPALSQTGVRPESSALSPSEI